ncbi:MAG: NAD(P)H-hydrate dehydratase [Firmicutes bacterium]|nr:NAD(P)H-hydrate dehydratase [Bacillota bacterium]
MQQIYTSKYNEFKLDEESFFRAFPKRAANAHKGSTGKILLISGSYGMAGAACLNILGARALGAPYINVMLPKDIYPVAASRFMEPVFYPYTEENYKSVLPHLAANCSAAAYGSGAVNNLNKLDILRLLLWTCKAPVVLDAEALNILSANMHLLDKASDAMPPIIITPHLGEFMQFTGKSKQQVMEDPAGAAAECAEKYGFITVLKGPETIVASPDERIYVNCSGNQGLAQAGSGDVLTGMITAMLSFMDDPFESACMGVFAHGMAADELCTHHAYQTMPLEEITQAMDRLFKKHGF